MVSLVSQIHSCRGIKPEDAGHTQPCVVVAVESLSRVRLFVTPGATPGSSVFHCLLEFAQTHVHRVGDAIQPSHPLSPPSPPAHNLSQQQGLLPTSLLFTSGSQSTGVSASASVLNIHWKDFQDGLVGSPCRPKDSQESPPAPQLKSINSSVLSLFWSPRKQPVSVTGWRH